MVQVFFNITLPSYVNGGLILSVLLSFHPQIDIQMYEKLPTGFPL